MTKWKTKDGSTVEIDGSDSRGRIWCGTVNGVRCLWDANSKQCWGKEGWDLTEEIKEDATTPKNK
jgi:hypothetical protein